MSNAISKFRKEVERAMAPDTQKGHLAALRFQGVTTILTGYIMGMAPNGLDNLKAAIGPLEVQEALRISDDALKAVLKDMLDKGQPT